MLKLINVEKFKKLFWILVPKKFHLILKMKYMLLTGNYDKEMILIQSTLRKRRRFILDRSLSY